MFENQTPIQLDYEEIKKFHTTRLFRVGSMFNDFGMVKEKCVGGLGKFLSILGFEKLMYFDGYPGDTRLGFSIDSETDDFIVKVTMSVIPKVGHNETNS